MKSSFKFYCTGIFVLFFNVSHAQNSIFSKKYYNLNEDIVSKSVVATFDSSYLIAGSMNYKAAIIKVDSLGNFVWARHYSEASSGIFNSIVPTSDSGFFVTGRYYNTLTSQLNILCVKIDINGDTLWTKSISGNGTTEAINTIRTNDNGFIILGNDMSSFPNSILVAKIDSIGNLLWLNYYARGNNSNYAYSINETADSGFVVSGYIGDFPPFSPYSYMMKLSSSGAMEWGKKYRTPGFIFCNMWDVEIDTDGYLCLLDMGNYFGVMKTDTVGNLVWCKSYSQIVNSCTNCTLPKIYKIHDGNYVIINGSLFGPDEMFKINSAGNLLWYQQLTLIPSDIIELSDNGLFIVGNGPLLGMRNSSIDIPHIGIVKTDSLGNGTLCTYPDHNTTVLPDTLFADTVNFNISSGGSANNINLVLFDDTLLVASGCVDFSGNVNEHESLNLLSIYPNPAHDEFYLTFKNVSGKCDVLLINSVGQEIYNISADASEHIIINKIFPPGFYIVIVRNQEKFQSGKLIIK